MRQPSDGCCVASLRWCERTSAIPRRKQCRTCASRPASLLCSALATLSDSTSSPRGGPSHQPSLLHPLWTCCASTNRSRNWYLAGSARSRDGNPSIRAMRPVWRPVVPRKGLPGGSRDDRRQGDGRASLGLRRDSPLPYLSLRIGLSRGAGLSPFASARADNRLIPSTTGGAAVRSLSLRSGDHRTGHPGEPPRLSLWRRCPPSRHTTVCPGAARHTAARLTSS